MKEVGASVPSPMPHAPLVEMSDMSIAFGGIRAVDNATVDLYPRRGRRPARPQRRRQVDADQDAVRRLQARQRRRSWINGKEAPINNPRDAKKYGIETIYQTLALADNVDATANLFLGRELLTRGARSTTRRWRPRRAR
jgi:D-xylose transport system ATP-binding protein